MTNSVLAKFWIYLFVNIGSLLFSLFVLHALLFDRTLRLGLNNHIIIVLLCLGLIYETVTIPWYLYRFWNGRPLVESPVFYLFFYMLDYPMMITQSILFAWATMERHILIFHEQWLSTKKKRLVLHYLPIILIIVYCIIYFVIIVFVPFCQQSFEMFVALNVLILCLFETTTLGTWDLFLNQVIPILVTVVFSIALLARAILHRRPANHRVTWQKYRKMTIQLLSISMLYIVFGTPMVVTVLLLNYGLLQGENIEWLANAIVIRTYIVLLFPFVCCASLPELRKKFRQILTLMKRGQIGIQQN